MTNGHRVLLSIAFGIAGFVSTALAIIWCWAWFVAEPFALSDIGFWHGAGIRVAALTLVPAEWAASLSNTFNARSNREFVTKGLITPLIYRWIIIGSGYLIHLMMQG